MLGGFGQCSGKRGDVGVAHGGLESLPGCVGAEKGVPPSLLTMFPRGP